MPKLPPNCCSLNKTDKFTPLFPIRTTSPQIVSNITMSFWNQIHYPSLICRFTRVKLLECCRPSYRCRVFKDESDTKRPASLRVSVLQAWGMRHKGVRSKAALLGAFKTPFSFNPPPNSAKWGLSPCFIYSQRVELSQEHTTGTAFEPSIAWLPAHKLLFHGPSRPKRSLFLLLISRLCKLILSFVFHNILVRLAGKVLPFPLYFPWSWASVMLTMTSRLVVSPKGRSN